MTTRWLATDPRHRWLLGGCPRCGGSLLLTDEPDCLQCGYVQYAPTNLDMTRTARATAWEEKQGKTIPFIELPCPQCGKVRLVREKRDAGKLCRMCAAKQRVSK